MGKKNQPHLFFSAVEICSLIFFEDFQKKRKKKIQFGCLFIVFSKIKRKCTVKKNSRFRRYGFEK